MTVPPRTTGPRSAPRDLFVVWGVGLLAATGLGLVVAFPRSQDFWLVFLVFTACFLGPCIGLAWLTVGAGRKVAIDARADENVETRWIEKAASGALLDLLMAMGLLLGAMGLFGLEVRSDVVLMGLWAFAAVDAALRYALLRRREA